MTIARGQHRGDQVAGVEEVPERAEEAPHRQRQADQVHRGEGDPDGHRQAPQLGTERSVVRQVHEVGAVHVDDSLDCHLDGVRKVVRRCQLRRCHRGDLVPVQDADQPHGELCHRERQDTRRDQGQFVPLGGQRLAMPEHREQDTGGAHNGERHGRGEQRHPVRDHHPGEHRADRDRDVPAPRRAVQHQEHQQHWQRGAQMIRLGEHQVRVVAELRRDHDPRRHREADQPFPPRRTAPGQQPGRQHQQRIGGGTRDVHVIRAQAAEQLDQRVFGNLGRVVRHVPEGPAAQQPVAVQHVPALQRLVSPVRGSRIRSGQPQVDEEQDDGHQDRAGKPHPAGKAAPRCFPCRLLSGNASSRVLRGTLARRTGETSDHAQTLAEARAPSLFL